MSVTIPFFRTEFNYDRDDASQQTGTTNNEPSLTRQEFAEEADINVIVERLGLGYDIPLNNTPPKQGDFTNLPDFTGAVTMIRRAQEVFDALPAKIRNRFQNDPEKYIEFFHDPENRDEAIKLGLVKKPQAEPKSEGEVTPSDTPPPPPKATATKT